MITFELPGLEIENEPSFEAIPEERYDEIIGELALRLDQELYKNRVQSSISNQEIREIGCFNGGSCNPPSVKTKKIQMNMSKESRY